jgi:hypothetical protein
VEKEGMLRPKNLILSHGEGAVKIILEHCLATTPFQFWGKTRLAATIEKRGYLPQDLFDYFRRAELDYVIFDREPPCAPLFAIEFDGDFHTSDRETRRRDILKNRLCKMAGIPLLRVGSKNIQPLLGKTSFLSYVLQILLRYKEEHEGKNYIAPEDPDIFTEEEYDEICRHNLPEVRMLRSQLADDYGIVNIYDSRSSVSRLAYSFQLGRSDYAKTETSAEHEGVLVLRAVNPSISAPEEWPIVRQISRKISLRLSYRTNSQPRPPWPKGPLDIESMESHLRWMQTEPLFFLSLPGVNWDFVASNILEHICLKQLLAEKSAPNPVGEADG